MVEKGARMEMSENSFGYVEIKDGKVVCYTGDSSNPTVHKFENDEIVSAGKLQKSIKDKIKSNAKIMSDAPDIQWAQDSSLLEIQKENTILLDLVRSSEQ